MKIHIVFIEKMKGNSLWSQQYRAFKTANSAKEVETKYVKKIGKGRPGHPRIVTVALETIELED